MKWRYSDRERADLFDRQLRVISKGARIAALGWFVAAVVSLALGSFVVAGIAAVMVLVMLYGARI